MASRRRCRWCRRTPALTVSTRERVARLRERGDRTTARVHSEKQTMVGIELERALRVQRIDGAPAAITASWKGGRELARTLLPTGDAEDGKEVNADGA